MNREKRFEIAAKSLATAREENRNGIVILVEGKRDVRALKELGFTGPIEQLNRGWSVDRFVIWVVENFVLPPIVLMDWDRTGGRLQRDIQRRMESLDVIISDDLRRTLSKSIRPETLCVETLYSLSEHLLPLIDIIDHDGANGLPSL